MQIKIYRDCDSRLRLRKVVIEIWDNATGLVDRTRMFAFPRFLLAWRLTRRVAAMKAVADIFKSINL